LARIAGRNGRVYLAIASGGTAEPIAFLNSWTINFQTEKPEVTAFGDSNKVYVSGLPDASGDFAGFYDDATEQFYTAATDGLARKFYLYPSTSNNSQYFYGEILPDMNINATVSGAVEISSTWNASSAISKKSS
jgi:hypothetical protein